MAQKRCVSNLNSLIWYLPDKECPGRLLSCSWVETKLAPDRRHISVHHPMAGGKPSEDEMRLCRADGEYRWFLVRTVPLRDEQGKVVKWYGVSIDIEDRKRAEEAPRSSTREQHQIAAQLERERARLVEAQEVAKIGSWEADLQSLSVTWSEQTHRIFETDPSRFRPTRPKCRDFIHPEDRAKVDAAFIASQDKLSPCTVEYRIVMPDGRVKFLEERWQAFLSNKGKPVRVAGTCRDITERIRAEGELQRLSGKLLRFQDVPSVRYHRERSHPRSLSVNGCDRFHLDLR